MNKEWESILYKSSAYWSNEVLLKPQINDASTNVTSNTTTALNPIQNIIEKASEKAEEYLFPLEAKDNCQFEEELNDDHDKQIDQNILPQVVQTRKENELEVSSSDNEHPCIVSCSECERLLIKQRKNKQMGRLNKIQQAYKVKKRFTVQQDLFIIQSVKRGLSFSHIAQSIPGSTISQIRHRFFRKLRTKSYQPEDQQINEMLDELQKIMSDEQSKYENINRLRSLITSLESELNSTKNKILQKYLEIFNTRTQQIDQQHQFG